MEQTPFSCILPGLKIYRGKLGAVLLAKGALCKILNAGGANNCGTGVFIISWWEMWCSLNNCIGWIHQNVTEFPGHSMCYTGFLWATCGVWSRGFSFFLSMMSRAWSKKPEHLFDRVSGRLGLCAQCAFLCLCLALSFSSFPPGGVAQSGVWGTRGCTAACDWRPHCTIYKEPVREREREQWIRNWFININCWSWICV